MNKIRKLGLILLNKIRNYVLLIRLKWPIRPYRIKLENELELGIVVGWYPDRLVIGVALFVIEVGIGMPLPAPKKGD